MLIQNAPEKPQKQLSHSPVTLQHSHQSSVEPNISMHRNDSSILVITAPLSNVMEHNEQQLYHHAYSSAHPSHRQQSQIVANIENNSMSYELDDDISQISFKHHLRHDEGTSSRGSLHNVYDDNTSMSTTNTSATTRNLATSGGDNDSNLNFHRIIPGLEEVKEHDDDDRRKNRQQNDKMGTSIFVENNDILNDQNYPKISHRHSTLLLPTTTHNSVSIDDDDDFLDKHQQKKRRRYSDTKLLNSCNFENEFLINKTNVFGSPTKNGRRSDGIITDLIFEKSGDDFDVTELNIQKVLEMDIQSSQNASADKSTNVVAINSVDDKTPVDEKSKKSVL